ncbi:MAG: protein-disulfide reductase DsbD family protein [Planctomycetota bacterium]|jgi:thiol:disulfide interchange protein DsbD|nr:protein-disulfide reductase DsbD family protein [Planctomycetota bacterium]
MSAFLLCAALFLPQFGVGSDGSAEITAGFAVDSVGAGSVVELQVVMEISDGWHAYHPDQDPENGIPISVQITGEGFEAAGELLCLQPAQPHTLEVGTFKAEYLWISGKPTFTMPVRVPTALGANEMSVHVKYQLCDDSHCLAPMSKTIAVPITITDATLVQAQEGIVSARILADGLGAGSVAELEITLDIKKDWHAYHPDQDPDAGTPTSVDISGEGWQVAGELTVDQEPHIVKQEIGDYSATLMNISGKPKFTIPVRLPATPGASELVVEFHYQLCDESFCETPTSEVLRLPVNVSEATSTSAGSVDSEGSDGDAGDPEGGVREAGTYKDDSAHGTQLPEGFWAFMLMAITAGAATLLTPCVFPMIPVTISYFTKRSEAGKGTPIGNATAYAGGIIFTFAGIGGGAALILGPTGANQIGSNPYVNTAIGLLFLAMAFSLLGYYEIQAPRFLQKFAANAQSGGQTKAGYLPVAVMAVAFSITAFTCTVAFVGAVFAAGLKLGPVYLFGGMFVYGLVFALPFFFLALFPSKLQSMPNAGGWMNTVKVCAGFVEIIAAVKFFSNADLFWDLEFLTWPIVFGFSALTMIVWAAYMFGLFKMPLDYEKPKPGKARFVFALLILLGGIYLIPGTFNREHTYPKVIYAFAPPPTYGLPGDIGPAGLTWFEDYEESFAYAREEGLPLFVDFTGVTCPNCRAMENGVFPTDEVKPLLKQFARVELWVDKEPKYAKMEVERFSQASQPFYVLLDPRDDSVLGSFPGYDPDASKFAEFLQAGLDMYQTNSASGPN